MSFLSLLTLLQVVKSALSARIAGFLIIGGPQYMNTRHTMEELAPRGHEVEKQSFYFACLFMLEGKVMWSVWLLGNNLCR